MALYKTNAINILIDHFKGKEDISKSKTQLNSSNYALCNTLTKYYINIYLI